MKRKKGFILATTLWFLVILTFVMSTIAVQTTNMIDNTRTLQQQQNAQIEWHNTFQILKYLLATRAYDYRGLILEKDEQSIVYGKNDGQATEIIKFDQTHYKGWGETQFYIQDVNGLIRLNPVDKTKLSNLLGLLGISVEKRIILMDLLQDYTDKDDLRHINGAEERTYRLQNRSLPTNTPLNSIYELKNIIGWDKEEKLWQNSRLLEATTTLNKPGLNINTIPHDALLSISGLSYNIADKIIKQRPFSNFFKVQREQSIHWPRTEHASIAIKSNGSFVIYLTHPSLNYRQQINLRLVPAHPQGYIWIIEYTQRISYDNEKNHNNKITANEAKEISRFLPFTQTNIHSNTE